MSNCEYLVLCFGDEGKELIKYPFPQIRLYQLQKVTRSEILAQYKIMTHSQVEPVSLVTKQRNLLIDMMLQTEQELIVMGDQRMEAMTKKKINFPLILQVVYVLEQFVLDSQTVPTLGHFSIKHKLSQGSFAEIFLAEQKSNRQLVAIKRINKSEYLEKASKKQLVNEVEVMKYRHWGKVHLKYLFENEQFVYLVQDYCPYGSLYDVIKYQQLLRLNSDRCEECQVMSKHQRLKIWLQVAFTIVHMHQRGYLYRDLKTENILIDQRGYVKICDFGSSTGYKPGEKFTQLCGTLEYIPLEMINGQEYDRTIDTYALGVLLYEVVAGRSPFGEISFENMKQLKSKPIKFDKKLFTDIQISLINSLTAISPQNRLGFISSLNIFRHPFFQQLEVKQLINDVIKRQVNYDLLNKFQFQDKKGQFQPKEYPFAMKQKFFQKPWSYLDREFQIEEKIGPKFNSAF